MIIQLILLDEKTKQPQKVETILEGRLDITSALQKQIYLNTINSLSYGTEYITDIRTVASDAIISNQLEVELYEPEETIEDLEN